jgi:hypothetical protein
MSLTATTTTMKSTPVKLSIGNSQEG